MATSDTFTDVLLKRNASGIYDLAIDEGNRDLAVTGGLDTALGCSLFSDRRADGDEVADPWRRRGWIGNLLADVPSDNFGSGLWLYEQRRGTTDVLAALALEARASLQWMIDGNLATSVDPKFTFDPKNRVMTVVLSVTDNDGSVTDKSFELWRTTGTGQLANNG